MNLLISTFKNDIKLLCRKGLLSSFILLPINCSQSIKLEGQILSFFPSLLPWRQQKTVSMKTRTGTGHRSKLCSPGSFHFSNNTAFQSFQNRSANHTCWATAPPQRPDSAPAHGESVHSLRSRHKPRPLPCHVLLSGQWVVTPDQSHATAHPPPPRARSDKERGCAALRTLVISHTASNEDILSFKSCGDCCSLPSSDPTCL